jgi:glycosyltransferase involved in cell wall biosynthesis
LNQLLVSIIISNYNYQRFLRWAIDSALNQTYPNIEVIVVDDGSTDNSRALIESYGDRIISVLKDNGGQASACNAGFAIAGGQVVIFLDGDDALLPDTVRLVVAAFEAHPGAVKVQYRQRYVDAHGKPTGDIEPACYQPMLSGDMRRRILKFHQYIWPTTSGNAFTSAVLRKIFPIPETLYRGVPDTHLCNLSVMFGPIISLDEVGVLYRVHGDNNYYGTFGSTNLASTRAIIVALADSYTRQERLFKTLHSTNIRGIGSRDLLFLMNRVVSKKLDPSRHPLREGLMSMCIRGCVVSMVHFDAARFKHPRLIYVWWFLGMFLAPRRHAKLLVEMFYYPEKRGRLINRLLR